MQIRFVGARLGLINSTTRLPFRYGKACLTKCPQATLEATIECQTKTQVGYSGDCLPPSWFDKSPTKDYEQQINDMLSLIRKSIQTFADEFNPPESFFRGWLRVDERVHQQADQSGLPGLLASFAVSLVERAIIDAMARWSGLSFAELIRRNDLKIEARLVHPELADCQPRDWLPHQPLTRIHVRHTIGLADPLTEAQIAPEDRVDDGYPQTLEQYVQQLGVRYLKVKVSNDLEADLVRLETIAAVAERHLGPDYCLTLDGNEQYTDPADFDRLIEEIQSRPQLQTLWRNTLLIEQPLPREISLNREQTTGIRNLNQYKAVIIDESDQQLDTYRKALELGYRGVSSKNCKGPIRSLLNAGLTWARNRELGDDRFLMTAEDLCTVGIIPVQSDLCLVATLGLTHVERNGHHYHPGLAYLPFDQQQQALARHPDFYEESGDCVRPYIVKGELQIASLQCVGFGFDVLPDFDVLEASDLWSYDSLGL
ncbi:MAG: mandelate racemase [Planctomycetaceae bacterium]|nr:mandelate racemase [Planctomycetaceae bacterium]